MAPEPTPPPSAPEPTEVTPEVEETLAEHEASFGDPARRPQPDPETEPEEDARRPPRERPRDDSGKFTKPGPPRHRAKSQEAGPGDVARISELTRRLRDTEAERDALKARVATPPAVSTERLPAPLIAALAPPSRELEVSQAPAKPKIDSFQDYSDYVEALADWKIGEARRVDRETAAREAEAHRVTESWRTRVESAKGRYQDFEAVALMAPTEIPQGSLVDAWILEHKSGADVLYSLQKDPAELRRILALPLFDQVDALSLLAQRLSPTREPAVSTGAAATTLVKVAPRPPTPVRTSAVPATEEPPGDDASVAEHEKWFGAKHRRV